MELILALVAGAATGAALAWFAARARFGSEAAALQAQLQMLTEQTTRERQAAEDTLRAERERQRDSLAAIEQARQTMADQFKVLANDILEDKAKRFAEQNQTNLQTLLSPLRMQIGEFKTKVEEVYRTEGQERSALAEQVKQLMGMNQQLSQRASDLTRALTSENKTQGNWGELVLERVLEASGLRKGHEYVVQASHTREDGTRAQPDVVVHLPGERQLVIDSKVSLNAYVAYVNDAGDSRDVALKRHLDSLRSHIKGLSEKRYQDMPGVSSLDFVIMFVPVEPAYMLAIGEDVELWQDAWQRNVLLVSPSTLLFVVRTVANLWRQEQQTRNAQEIAERGAALYDKFAGFAEALEAIGERLVQARSAYDTALTRFSGNGGLLAQTQLLKKLGVKARKEVPDAMRRRLAADEQQDDDPRAAGPHPPSLLPDPEDSAPGTPPGDNSRPF